jgi:hypothetical protein
MRARGIEAFVLATQCEWTEFHLCATADCKTCVEPYAVLCSL